MGMVVYGSFIPTKNVAEAVKKLKEEWKKKMDRMEIISVDVAKLELSWLIDKIMGSFK